MPEKQQVEIINHQLELDENLHQHLQGWKIQRIGWGVLYLGLLLALLGLFGTGPLSYQTNIVNGNKVEYERFLRYEGETEMTFHLTGVHDSIRLEVPRQYLAYIDVKTITPYPLRNETINDITTYYFPAQGAATIHCSLMAKRPGNIEAVIVANKTPFTITHLIYP